MFQEWIDRRKAGGNEAEEKKKPGLMRRENFLVMALLGILLLVIIWPVENEKAQEKSSQWDRDKSIIDFNGQDIQNPAEETTSGTESGASRGPAADYATYLEKSLEELLATMEGVGKVRVMVTLVGSGEAIVEKDSSCIRNGTTEVDSAGGSRNTTDLQEQEETVYGSQDTPYVRQVLSPEVAGVLVSAQGGGNALTVKNITEAIQALFSIDAHKIKIVKMNPS